MLPETLSPRLEPGVRGGPAPAGGNGQAPPRGTSENLSQPKGKRSRKIKPRAAPAIASKLKNVKIPGVSGDRMNLKKAKVLGIYDHRRNRNKTQLRGVPDLTNETPQKRPLPPPNSFLNNTRARKSDTPSPRPANTSPAWEDFPGQVRGSPPLERFGVYRRPCGE